MNNLLRKISKKKWTDNTSKNIENYSADSITSCIRTSQNTLSLWKSSTTDFSDSYVEELVVALAVTTQRPDVIDVIWLDKNELEQLGFQIQDSSGATPFERINDRHCDIINMDYNKLGKLGVYLVSRINDDNKVKRYSKKKILELVRGRVEAGDIDTRSLSDYWKNEL